MAQMYASVFSALLLGIVPFSTSSSEGAFPLTALQIAPPVSDVVIHDRISASGVLVMDANTGQQLYGQHITTKRAMASLTKLMTALVIVENHDLKEVVKIPQNIAEVPGSVAYLPPGQYFTVGDLLSALLIHSANDAAYTLAVFHSGSSQEFVKVMNERAKALGMNDTQYANPSGMDSVSQWTTPKDMAWVTLAAMRHPEIRTRMGTESARIYGSEGGQISLWHTHDLIHGEDRILAGKTGTTPMAGECLVSLVEQNGREYLVILLKSLRRYGDMKTIIHSIEQQQNAEVIVRTPSLPTPSNTTHNPDSVAASLR